MRVLMTVVAVLSEAGGVYCEESLSPAYSHIWVYAVLVPVHAHDTDYS